MDSLFFYRPLQPAASESGPLHKVKIAIQPNLSVAGWPTEAGSPALSGFIALEDATLTKRLLKSGAELHGSTRMSEFGFGLQDSRAGSAVKSDAVDAELILDLMGESRLSAARAGVFGFKPSYGIMSRSGLVGLIPSMECCGLVSGNLKMIGEILKNLSGPDESDFSLPEKSVPDPSSGMIDPEIITIGVIEEAVSLAPRNIQESFAANIEEFKKAGFKIKRVSMTDFFLASPSHQIIGSVEASSCAGRYDSVRYGKRAPGARNWNEMYLQSRKEAFGLLMKSYLFQGAFFQFKRYKAYEDACRIRARLLKDVNQLFSQVDFLALPAVNVAFQESIVSLADTYAQFDLTVFANATGISALYMPEEPGSDQGGIQLAGPRLSDFRLLGVAESFVNRNGKGA